MGNCKRKKADAATRKRRSPNRALKSFDQLKEMLTQKEVTLPSDPPPVEETYRLPPDARENEDDRSLFQKAMADVIPLNRRGRLPLRSRRRAVSGAGDCGEREELNRLRNLVEHGKGFIVADTPEYIEGVRYCDNPEIARRLHRGDFSIQSHIDLHGLITADAREALEGFLKDAITSGKRAVLVVHGRGLSSPGKPVLKTKVQEWLTHGPWRKWVIAFTSARSCDGGAGATYVLLRRSPYTKRYRKKGKVPDRR